MDKNLKEVKDITFGVCSAEYILKNSVCQVDNTRLSGPESGTVYDPAMGPCFDSVTKCTTCGYTAKDCTGHFGHIKLAYPVVNTLFSKYVINYLKSICSKCYRLILTEEQIILNEIDHYEGMTKFNKILEKIEKIDICSHCCHFQPDYTLTPDGVFVVTHNTKDEMGNKKNVSINLSAEDILDIFENINDIDIKLLGMDPKYIHPKNFILTYLPVMPPASRPPIFADGNISDDDITAQLIEIIKKNNELLSLNTTEDISTKIKDLAFNIEVLFDNSKGKAKHNANNREKNTIKARLGGKDGLLRGHLMGKRSDQTARTVIGPGAQLKMDEIGVPEYIADILTVPVHVNAHNFKEMYDLVNKKDGANFITNLKGCRINLNYALYKKGTKPIYGDVIIRKTGNRIKVKDDIDKFVLTEGDMIERNGKILKDIRYTQKRNYDLKIGEIVHRKLQKGDPLLLNRQPTLHQVSMMMVKAVPQRGKNSQKTITMNLSVTKSFNADFDGDEIDVC